MIQPVLIRTRFESTIKKRAINIMRPLRMCVPFESLIGAAFSQGKASDFHADFGGLGNRKFSTAFFR